MTSRKIPWGLIAVPVFLCFAAGCTNVRYSRRNPQTGEVWTVYAHTFADDTVSYCAPPQWGGACMSARAVSGPPGYWPSQVYTNPPVAVGAPPAPMPWGPPPPAQNGWRR